VPADADKTPIAVRELWRGTAIEAELRRFLDEGCEAHRPLIRALALDDDPVLLAQKMMRSDSRAMAQLAWRALRLMDPAAPDKAKVIRLQEALQADTFEARLKRGWYRLRTSKSKSMCPLRGDPLRDAPAGPSSSADARIEGRAEGSTEALVNAVLTVLRVRGIAVPDAARQRIQAERDLGRLERWLERASVASSVAEVIDDAS
jgi:hypothetical protein